jgi:short-subunit dehydrogenase
MGPYNVTKAGVVALSETLRADLAKDNIGVSVLCPTFFQTNIGNAGRGAEHLKPVIAQLLAAGKLSADDVARIAIEGCEKNDLYIAPHADGRWMWRMKRLAPETFYNHIPRVFRWRLERMQRRA